MLLQEYGPIWQKDTIRMPALRLGESTDKHATIPVRAARRSLFTAITRRLPVVRKHEKQFVSIGELFRRDG